MAMSFYSRALYRDIGTNWKGTGFLYLLLLLAICWLPIMYQFDRGLESFATKEAPIFIAKMPVFTVKNGQISIDKPLPFIVSDESGNPFIVIDTKAKYADLIQQPGQIFVSDTEIIVKKEGGQVQVIDLPKDLTTVMGPAQVTTALNGFKSWAVFILYPILVLSSYIYRILQALIYAGIGCLILAPIMKVKLNYTTVLRLSVIAVTPAIILNTILSLLAWSFPFESLFYFVITMIYLMFGLSANKPFDVEGNINEP